MQEASAKRSFGGTRSGSRRFAYALAFLMVIGLAATGVFTRSRPPDAKSILIPAAQAMEAAKTMHMILRNDSPRPREMSKRPGYGEMWEGPRSEAMLSVTEGRVVASQGLNLDTGEWWKWEQGKPMYLADLRPLGAKAEAILEKNLQRQSRGGQWLKPADLATAASLKNETQSVTRTTRKGRLVDVVTVVGDAEQAGRTYRARHVYVVDVESKRLVSSSSFDAYAGEHGQKPMLIAITIDAEYDLPIPANLRPKVGAVVPATAEMEEKATSYRLTISAKGQQIWSRDYPK